MATDRLQAFTAVGIVEPGTPYQVDMGDGFRPFRRDVSWREAIESADPSACLDTCSFSRGNKHWGYQLRFGAVRDTAKGSDADRGRDGREIPRCWLRRGNRFAASLEPLAYRGSISPRAHPARVVRAKFFERAARDRRRACPASVPGNRRY